MVDGIPVASPAIEVGGDGLSFDEEDVAVVAVVSFSKTLAIGFGSSNGAAARFVVTVNQSVVVVVLLTVVVIVCEGGADGFG